MTLYSENIENLKRKIQSQELQIIDHYPNANMNAYNNNLRLLDRLIRGFSGIRKDARQVSEYSETRLSEIYENKSRVLPESILDESI